MLPATFEMLPAASPSDECEDKTITMEVSNTLRWCWWFNMLKRECRKK